ncbi:MAG TPA: SH3 domain-containing protein [Jiangellaceae bacterium]|nr:SH3 domain-containing protein [Jiangellaceae bacterium]
MAAAGATFWPGGPADGVSESDLTATMSTSEREVPLSRGSVGRPPVPTPSVTPSVSVTPVPTPSATPTPTPVPTVTGHMYVTTGLNVRSAPGENSEVLTVLARGTKVGVTGNVSDSWAQIIYDDQPSWVAAEYLSETEPAAEQDSGISQAACASGSAVEEGLTPDAIRVHRGVCARFPDVSSYGGLRSDGEHGEGRALDIMVSGSSLGDAIAAWVRDNYKALGVSEVIWSQQIWTVERSSDGWRYMEDRGSATANHYDHVHVTVYGDSGTL